MNHMLVIAAVSLISGVLGSLGMGAGAVLLLYLRVYGGYEQLEAQGINLLFFLPIAVLSIILHSRNHLITWKAAAFCILSGLPAVLFGVWLGERLGSELLSKLFGIMLLIIGVREFKQKK
ncbi:sulfite exporter TauE/SafE family protein [Marasmitruncus massiliensis]|jgi:hypothetical protein|uniref:sulfite exporter TauE/SafE family protein n=1 Tax=Marasmitruncus massiliensis TaxID=1944642 RepID=UPI000C7CEA0E|nr:sulfite exporter TauE/SafE family protein [Marasmitruncus massiliensis]MBE6907584.1 sulfite exporter TauE/SafE family protein [Oscillospiraceae bacterium]